MSRLSRFGWVLAMACLSGSVLLVTGIYRVTKPIPVVDQAQKKAAPPVPGKTDDLRNDLNRVVSLERCNMGALHQAAADVSIQVDFRSMETIAQGKAEVSGHRQIFAAELQNIQSASSAGNQLIASANVGTAFDDYRKLQLGVEQIKKREINFRENELALLDTMFAMAESEKKRGYATASEKKIMDGYASEVRQKEADWESFKPSVDADTTSQWIWMDRVLGGKLPPDKFFAKCPPPVSLVRFDDNTRLRLPVSQDDLDHLLASVQGHWSGFPHRE